MTDTKALDQLLDNARGLWIYNPAAAELAELKAELEHQKNNYAKAFDVAAGYNLEIAQLRSDLEEARKAINEALTQLEIPDDVDIYAGNAFRALSKYLTSHPKDSKAPEEITNPYLLTGEELKRAEDKAKRREKEQKRRKPRA